MISRNKVMELLIGNMEVRAFECVRMQRHRTTQALKREDLDTRL